MPWRNLRGLTSSLGLILSAPGSPHQAPPPSCTVGPSQLKLMQWWAPLSRMRIYYALKAGIHPCQVRIFNALSLVIYGWCCQDEGSYEWLVMSWMLFVVHACGFCLLACMSCQAFCKRGQNLCTLMTHARISEGWLRCCIDELHYVISGLFSKVPVIQALRVFCCWDHLCLWK